MPRAVDVELGLPPPLPPDPTNSAAAAKPEAQPEAIQSTWRGRAMSSIPPCLASLSGLFLLGEAGYWYSQKNEPFGHANMFFAVTILCTSSCYWKYYFQANWNKNVKGLERLVNDFDEHSDATTAGVEKLAKERLAIEKIAEKEEKLAAVSEPQIRALNEKIDQLNQKLSEVNIPKDLNEVLTKRIAVVSNLINGEASALENKLPIMQAVFGSLDELVKDLKRKIGDLSDTNNTLKGTIKDLAILIEQLKGSFEVILISITEKLEQIGDLEKKLAAEREKLQKTIPTLGPMVERLGTIERDMEERLSRPPTPLPVPVPPRRSNKSRAKRPTEA